MRNDQHATPLRRALTAFGLIAGLFTATAAAADVTFSTKSSPDIDLTPSTQQTLEGVVGSRKNEVLPESGQTLLQALLNGRQSLDVEIEYSYDFVDTLEVSKRDKQMECLTEALYFEARGESAQGVFAVAEVILNRVESKRFPNTICKVVNQGTGRKYACQFSYTCDGIPEVVNDKKSWSRMEKVARLMVDGGPRALTEGSLFYHTKAVNPYWAASFNRVATIGEHHFYTYS